MKNIKMTVEMIMILLISAAAGILLLTVSYSIPTGPIFSHVAADSYVFKAEGQYPMINGDQSKILDNYTDSLMLGTAAYKEGDKTDFQNAISVSHPQYGTENPVASLLSYTSGKQGDKGQAYSRYWHGYLILLKPFLCFGTYIDFRIFNLILQVVLLAVLFFLFCRAGKAICFLPFALSVWFLRPEVLFRSLQNSCVFYLILFAGIAEFSVGRKFREKNRLWFLFLLFGILTAYFDLLTYPLAVLGFMLVFLFILFPEESVKKNSTQIAGFSLVWAIGYFGMWAEKWLIGECFSDQHTIRDALASVSFRTSHRDGGHKLNSLDAIGKNLNFGFGKYGFPIFILIVLALLIISLLLSGKRKKSTLFRMIPMMVIGLYPFIWFAVIVNHSYVHSFPYRLLAVTVFSFLSIPLQGLGELRIHGKN